MKTIRFAVLVFVFAACTKDPEPFDLARIAGSELLKKESYPEAATQYEKSLELKPEQDAKVWDRAAFANMKAGNFDRAAELLEKSIARRPEPTAKSDTLRNIAGMYLQQANDLGNAEKYFLKAAELDPKDEQALGWLAEISSRRGGARVQTAEAQTDQLTIALTRYDAVIALNPNKPDSYVNKRIVLVKYLDHLGKQKLSILADAESQKADKEAYADMQQQAADTQARIDELKTNLDETTKKLGEAAKAAKAAK